VEIEDMRMIRLTIDGQAVEVPEGATLLEAAQKLGIWIPTLCHHEALTPYGGCRLCAVELQRRSAAEIVSSCSYEAAEGLEVHTVSKKVLEIRKFIISLLLTEAPDAEILQELAAELGVSQASPLQPSDELCISCGRCIRACREIVGASAIDFAKRGYEKKPASPFFERSESCIGCGTCVAICPTGAIRAQDLAEGERAMLADGAEVTGPARIIHNWNAALPLKRCTKCGEYFAPQFQLEYIAGRVPLAPEFLQVCLQCRA
jgi:bidirectional [NiFe] hydrogenase diaphorase subunit